MSKERVKVSMDYNLKSHIIGKIWLALSLAIFFAVPTTICLYYDVKPDMSVMGTSAVLIPFIINFFSGIFEPIIYSPMLGINSAYLAFITGNLSNLKIPCVVKAQEICGTKLGVGSAYLFVGIALCAIFGILQVVREKKKQKLQEEKEHLEGIAVSDVELDENSANAVKSDDEQSENQNEEQNEEQALEDVEKEAEQIAEDTQSVD